jgi:hypothetical protein
MSDNRKIIVVVLGGMVQDVRFPEDCGTAVAIHDYDVGRGDRDLHRDSEGDLFAEALWEPPEIPGSDSLTGVAEIDELSSIEVRKILARVFQWMYWDSDTGQWDLDRDISGADTVQLLCELLPYPPEPSNQLK